MSVESTFVWKGYGVECRKRQGESGVGLRNVELGNLGRYNDESIKVSNPQTLN
jgi:hypothetical protein